jgi:hypothetical protein
VSNDNAYIESLFGTTKQRPEYPPEGFESLELARDWVKTFITWYNTEHRHSAIRYVTPADRHAGKDADILANRKMTLLTLCVSVVVQLAISPEFNQSGAAWEHSCHVIPKNVKPPC